MTTATVRETIDLPLIINGRCVSPSEREDIHHIDYEGGLRIRVPVMQMADLERLNAERPALSRALNELNNNDITLFLSAVGERWLSGKAEGRRLAETYAHAITGFPPAMMSNDYATIGFYMAQRFHIYETIDAEFGSEKIFDEWIPRQMCYIRAFPRGLVVHYLVGNLPLASIYTVLRGVISRNCTLAKLPSRDPVSVMGLIQTMLEVDPNHPITRSISVAYWPHDAPIADACLQAGDAVCVWGGGEAVEAVKRKVRANVPVADYGPRWSASVIDLTACDPEEAAYRLVEDVSLYDQEACFSAQRAWVYGDIAPLRAHLRTYFDRFATRYPLATTNRDALAHRTATLLEARYLGLEVDEGHDWAIVVCEQSDPPPLVHPLTRTLFLHKVNSLNEVARHLDSYSQTLGLLPWDLVMHYRDEWARAGANRFVELGWSRLPREGWTHDATYGLHALVRLVAIERPRSDLGKYYPRPVDPKTWQRSHFLGEKWWPDS